jgi:hypothetical protein
MVQSLRCYLCMHVCLSVSIYLLMKKKGNDPNSILMKIFERSRQYLISGHPFRSVSGMPTLTAD